MTKFKDAHHVYVTLQNLSNLEVAYKTYSKSNKNFTNFQTYFDYLNNPIIQKYNLTRFYFPQDTLLSILSPYPITQLEEITDKLTIVPDYSIALAKQFNFLNGIQHKCNYYSGIYLLEGTAQLNIEGEFFTLERGTFFIIPPDFYYSIDTDDESICIFFNLRKSYIESEYQLIFQEYPILTRFILETFDPEKKVAYLSLKTSGRESINDLVLNLFLEYINQSSYSNSVMKNYLALFFAEIMRDPELGITSSIQITKQEQQYQHILEYLKKNYKQASLTEVSTYFNFTKQYICKIIKQHSDMTFGQLLTTIKLNVAEQYLLETNLTLETISIMCGYSSASHLSKVFKKYYNLSPNFYRLSRSTVPLDEK